MEFQLVSAYQPAGDQPAAIASLTEGLLAGESLQTLLGVTGSGKTFTIANVIAATQKPTLVIAHNKTLAAQLCNEFRTFFPHNAVEYFVSYYDYYQPEAYLPRTDTYIEKEAMINDEIDRLRHASTQALLTRKDVIIVASVSCMYGLGSPEAYKNIVLHIQVGGELTRTDLLRRLIAMQFTRTTADVTRGTFRSRGEILEFIPVSDERLYRVIASGDKVEEILILDPLTRQTLERVQEAWVFPAKHYVVDAVGRERAVHAIRAELKSQLAQFEREGKVIEYERLSRRTRYDLELIDEVGYCNGIENYSRHFEGRSSGEPPYTLLDYFGKDALIVIDESHVTLPQIGGMSAGDRARKDTLVSHGFRLPSAVDNRPLTFTEFQARLPQTICVSATPGTYEQEKSTRIVEQIIRPTGLVDPIIEVHPVTGDETHPGQIEHLLTEIDTRVERHERTLVTTLTKKMAEELTGFLKERGRAVQYLHSDIDTLERVQILTDFRRGTYDVLVGVNLLREGLDLPEVTLVAILDADKEGFLRSETSLIQTIGRAARNVNGRVLLYADKETGSLKRAIDETERRRNKQIAYNEKHGITPQTIQKEIADLREVLGIQIESSQANVLQIELTADPHDLRLVMAEKEKEMKRAAQNLDFETAAILRDQLLLLTEELNQKEGKAVPKKQKRRSSSL